MSTATQEIAKSTSVLPADLRKLQLRNLRLEGTFSRSLEGTHREMAAPARSHRTLPDVLTHRQTTEVVRSRSLILTACSMKDLSVDRPLNDVEVVDLSNNQFEDIPSDVLAAQLSVKKLYLHANRFTSLSDSFEHLSALTELYLGYNNISWLSPKALNGLSQLRRLELNNNELAELPTGIGNLSNLEYLNVSFNQLQTLPSTVSRLAALRVLLLENNKLVTLPMSLGTLDSLERLSLASNPLVSPPVDVVARGAQAVVEYLRADIQVEPEALFCTAEGDGLHSATAGAPAHLTVHAIDRFGRQAPRGGHDFALFLVGPSDRVEIGGEDSDNGQYALWYRAEVAGSYEVHLTLAGAHVNGSPFAVTVSPGPADPASSRVTGTGTMCTVAGEKTAVELQARDCFSNPLLVGGESVRSFAMSTHGTYPAVVSDRNNGTYGVTYIIPREGQVELTVMMGGQHVVGSPFVVNVTPAPDPQPRSLAKASFVERALAGTRGRLPKWNSAQRTAAAKPSLSLPPTPVSWLEAHRDDVVGHEDGEPTEEGRLEEQKLAEDGDEATPGQSQ